MMRQEMAVIPVDEEVAREFAHQKACLKRDGMMVEDADILIGATAITHNLVMVTENVKHIGRLQGINIERMP